MENKMREERRKMASEKAEEICKMLRDNDIYADVEQYDDLPVVNVSIYRGDWKHEHARAKWLISENIKGVIYLNTKVTEDDGSDCYSADHRYIFEY